MGGTNEARREYTTRNDCRVCGHKNLVERINLGDQYVSDFVKPEDCKKGNIVPIVLDQCQSCSLVQARHTAPQDFLYTRHYWYRSGVTKTMRDSLRDVASAIENRVDLRPGDVVLDIGSNDGTLLRSYSVDGLYKVGVEPATNLAEEGNQGVDCFINDFWGYENYEGKLLSYLPKVPKAKVITALGMFYDLEDPNQFIADVAEALAPDGVFVAQLMCLADTLSQGDIGNLAHEHLEFYTLRSLMYLYRLNGLEITDLECNNINGGSYRIWAVRSDSIIRRSSCTSSMLDCLAIERDLEKNYPYEQFNERVRDNAVHIRTYVTGAVASGKTVWVYGASTKGNVLLQHYGLDSSVITGAAERSPEKYGLCTVGTGIPIYSEDEMRKAKPDYLLVLPYAFIDEFVEREQEFLQRGGKFIVPLPYAHITLLKRNTNHPEYLEYPV